VSLLVEENQVSAFNQVCATLSLEVTREDGYSSVGMNEERVVELLALLGDKGIPLHGLTITRATLEDYFMSQAGSPEVARV
jgi:hypothetical protein